MNLYELGPAVRETPPPGDEAWMMYVHTVLGCAGPIEFVAEKFGLPPKMAQSAMACARHAWSAPSEDEKWTSYLTLCLILVQGRKNNMTREEIYARNELESALMELLYG